MASRTTIQLPNAKIRLSMRHHYTIQEGSYRLRPVSLEDAAFIVALRTDPARSRFIHPTSPSVVDQENWLRDYFERDGDFYFVIEHARSGEAEGTLGIYNVDGETHSAEWGRWVVRPRSKAAMASCLLALDLAFGTMKLQSLYSYVAAENRAVLDLLRFCGMKGEDHDPVRMQIFASDWRQLQ